uniref:DNA topoisomerase (ATP-hydrolyzing) n=1 Tax=Phallusia mammillata TaxID=59560 RepID=A0A6F9DU87_9ASCI|nr:meiotic recombination protein SPO11 [Phallusia mammillata]
MCDEPTLKTIAFGHSSTREKFGLIMKVLAKVYKLLQTDQVATKRDLYYEEPQLFKKQTVLDQLVDEIACLLEVPRRWLNVVATSKGCLVGDLTFSGPDAEQVDCSQSTNGVMVPTLVDLVDNFESKTARFILVVEKDATFQRLQDDCFAANMQCIMITGKGVPDVNTRLMIKKMWNALQIPVLGLFDADPHGIEIMCVYRFGSLAQSHDSQSLALPFLKWIGVFPSDIKRLHLPADVVTALTNRAVVKCRDMLTRPYVAHFARLRNELTLMAENRQKAEIQALTRLSAKYLSQVFIPTKIKHGDWI